jgi:hypothetical protein
MVRSTCKCSHPGNFTRRGLWNMEGTNKNAALDLVIALSSMDSTAMHDSMFLSQRLARKAST